MDMKELISEKLKEKNMQELYCLEYSEHLSVNGLFSWHVGTLDDAIQHNIQDMFYNNRGPNKWQIVWVGTAEECDEMMNAYSENKKRNAEKYRPSTSIIERIMNRQNNK